MLYLFNHIVVFTTIYRYVDTDIHLHVNVTHHYTRSQCTLIISILLVEACVDHGPCKLDDREKQLHFRDMHNISSAFFPVCFM